MERRTLLAIILAMVVVVVPAILFPPKRVTPPAREPSPDTAAARAAPESLAVRTVETVPRQDPQRRDTAPAESVTVSSPLYAFRFSTRGARLVGAELREYRSFAPGDAGLAELIPPESEFLSYRLVVGRDTVALAEWSFEPSSPALAVGPAGAELVWTAQRGPLAVRLTYAFRPDSYLFDVHGVVTGASGGGLVLISLGPRLRSV